MFPSQNVDEILKILYIYPAHLHERDFVNLVDYVYLVDRTAFSVIYLSIMLQLIDLDLP